MSTTELTYNEQVPQLRGHWKLEVYEGEIEYGQDGAVLSDPIEILQGDNLVVTVGKQLLLDRLFGLSSVAAMTRIGVGTSATAAALGNTTLTGSAFKAFDATPTRTTSTVTAIATFGTSEGNLSWNELGLDNGTTLFNRIAPIGPFTKTSAVSIIVTVQIAMS